MIVRPVLCRPFVGRRAELAYLKERRLEAGASRGGLVFVAGDAGLGKSRLVDDFAVPSRIRGGVSRGGPAANSAAVRTARYWTLYRWSTPAPRE